MLLRVSKRLPKIGLIALMSLLVLSWSTCPSLYINSVWTLVGADGGVCSCSELEATCPCCPCAAIECEAVDQHDGGTPERCPLCESIGSMHALATVEAPATPEVPVLTVVRLVVAAAIQPHQYVAERLEPDFSPPDEQFTTTVRLLC